LVHRGQEEVNPSIEEILDLIDRDPVTSRKIDAVMRDAHSGRLCYQPIAAGEVELAR
jgi:hypothetical protein